VTQPGEVRLLVLEKLAKACAIAAGLLLVLITILTCVSVIGRDTIGKAITGDFELVGVAAGGAIALFLPWCQVKRSNIIVDFFTSRASLETQDQLDRLGALLLGILMAVLAWRTTLGCISAYGTQSGSMMLGFPDWITYVVMVPPMVLTAAIALHQAAFGFRNGIAR
jgi:TRAP-type C4-dicarboxylate transport system permease small subunit